MKLHLKSNICVLWQLLCSNGVYIVTYRINGVGLDKKRAMVWGLRPSKGQKRNLSLQKDERDVPYMTVFRKCHFNAFYLIGVCLRFKEPTWESVYHFLTVQMKIAWIRKVQRLDHNTSKVTRIFQYTKDDPFFAGQNYQKQHEYL